MKFNCQGMPINEAKKRFTPKPFFKIYFPASALVMAPQGREPAFPI
jgi:hypothetical protein